MVWHRVTFGLSMVILSVAFAQSVLWAARGRSITLVFAGGVLAWASYLAAHKIVTGRFVDPPEEGRTPRIPPQWTARIILTVAVTSMVVGPMVGLLGIHLDSLPVTTSGTAIFLVGYVFVHRLTTDSLL